MNNDYKMNTNPGSNANRGFFATLLMSLARSAFLLIIAFAVGTGGSAIACWYYDIPLVFSLLGGLIVLGLAVALMSDSLFS